MKDHSRSLRTRVSRLEVRQTSVPPGGGLPPGFWGLVCGTIPLDQADPETRRMVAGLCRRKGAGPDPVEEEIAAMEALVSQS